MSHYAVHVIVTHLALMTALHKESPQVLPMQHKEDAQAIYERIELRARVVGTQEA